MNSLDDIPGQTGQGRMPTIQGGDCVRDSPDTRVMVSTDAASISGPQLVLGVLGVFAACKRVRAAADRPSLSDALDACNMQICALSTCGREG